MIAVGVARDLPRSPILVAASVAGAAIVGAGMGREPRLALAATVLIAGTAAILAWPQLATLLVVLLIWLNAPAIAVSTYGVPLMIAAFIPLLPVIPLVARLARGERFIMTHGLILMLVLLSAQLASTLGSPFQEVASEKIKTFLIEGVVLYALVVNVVRTPAVLRLALWTILLAAAFLAAITIVQKTLGNYTAPYGGFAQVHASYFIGKSDVPRVAGPIGDPNYYAQILLVAVPLGLLSIWRERSLLLRWVAVASTGMIIVAIMLTYSRGAGLGFLIVFLIMAFLRYFRLSQVIAVTIGVLVLLTTVPAYKDRVASVSSVGGAAEASGSSEGADMSTQSRAAEMLAAAYVFLDHPVTGVGPGVFPRFYQEYANRLGLEVHETTVVGVRRGEEAQRQAHNMFLSLAADLGVIGIAAFGALLWVTLRDLIRARRRALAARRPEVANLVTGLLLAVAAYLATGMFLTLAFERYFWLLLALAGAGATMVLRWPVSEVDDGRAVSPRPGIAGAARDARQRAVPR